VTVEPVVDPTTVNGHDLPGDECAVVRGQVHECACKVGGVSSLGKRLALRHHPGEFRFIGSFEFDLVLRSDRSGHHTVDPDAIGADFPS